MASVTLWSAGCPQPVDTVTEPTPSSGSTGGNSMDGGGGVGPERPSPDASTDGGTENPAGDNTPVGPAVVGGDTAGATSNPDALTVEFPGCEEPVEGDFWRAEILRLVNQERLANGLDPLTLSQTLENLATEYACELIHYDYFGHVNGVTGSTLTERAKSFGYDYWIIGENLAAGQRSPVQAVSDWLNSPCHRENILNPAFTELGVGIRIGGDYGFYWVQEFGRPFASEPYSGPRYSDPECVHEE